MTLNKAFVGFDDEVDPTTAPSNKQQSRRLKHFSEMVATKVQGTVRELLSDTIAKHLSSYFTVSDWQLTPDEADPQTLHFIYPSSFNYDGEYIKPKVKLEFGARGSDSPSECHTITPYLFQALPMLQDNTSPTAINVLSPIRTYWEKITLLHSEYNRPSNKILPNRLFRHYYDICMLDNHGYTEKALQSIELLEDVVKNKMIYFKSSWSKYNEAKIGSIKIQPNIHFSKELKRDSKAMMAMFFDNAVNYDVIVEQIGRIEEKINNG